MSQTAHGCGESADGGRYGRWPCSCPVDAGVGGAGRWVSDRDRETAW